MHKTAEQGIAAHWRYKEGEGDEKVTEKFAWLRQLLDWQQDTAGDAHDFMETLKIDLFPEEAYVLHPSRRRRNRPEAPPRSISPIRFIPPSGISASGPRSTTAWCR